MEESQRPRARARVAAMKVSWNDSVLLCSSNLKCWSKCLPRPAFLLIALKEHRKAQPWFLKQLLYISGFLGFFSLNHCCKNICSGLCKKLDNEKGILFEIIYSETGLVNSLHFWSYILCRCIRKDKKGGKYLYYRQTLCTEQILPVSTQASFPSLPSWSVLSQQQNYQPGFVGSLEEQVTCGILLRQWVLWIFLCHLWSMNLNIVLVSSLCTCSP